MPPLGGSSVTCLSLGLNEIKETSLTAVNDLLKTRLPLSDAVLVFKDGSCMHYLCLCVFSTTHTHLQHVAEEVHVLEDGQPELGDAFGVLLLLILLLLLHFSLLLHLILMWTMNIEFREGKENGLAIYFDFPK